MDGDQVGVRDDDATKILQTVIIPGSVVPNCSLPQISTFLKFKYENANKIKSQPYPAQVRPSLLTNEIMTLKSRETIHLIP
jgi:hypothetical protein